MKNRALSLLLFAVFAPLCFSCASKVVDVFKYCDLQGARFWSADNPAVIEYDNADSLTFTDIDIFIRYHKNADLSIIPLVVKTISPDSLYWQDTVFMITRDVEGVIRGNKQVTDIEYSQLYRDNVVFPLKGTYVFEIWPLERTDVDDFNGIGIKIGLKSE